MCMQYSPRYHSRGVEDGRVGGYGDQLLHIHDLLACARVPCRHVLAGRMRTLCGTMPFGRRQEDVSVHGVLVLVLVVDVVVVVVTIREDRWKRRRREELVAQPRKRKAAH